jgi:hypothetical protein
MAAPNWVMVTHPEEGTVHCLCCDRVTDPQDYAEGKQEHTDDCNAVALLEFVAGFVDWAENCDEIFAWGRDGDETLHNDEGWRGLVADATAAIKAALGEAS